MMTPTDVRGMMAVALRAAADYAESHGMDCSPPKYLVRVTNAGFEAVAKTYPTRLTCEDIPDVGTALIINREQDGMDEDAAAYFIHLVGAFQQAMQQFVAPLSLLHESTDPSTFGIVGVMLGRALRVMLQRTLDFDEAQAQNIHFTDVLQHFDASQATPQ